MYSDDRLPSPNLIWYAMNCVFINTKTLYYLGRHGSENHSLQELLFEDKSLIKNRKANRWQKWNHMCR